MATYRITLAVDEADLPAMVKAVAGHVAAGLAATQFLVELDPETVHARPVAPARLAGAASADLRNETIIGLLAQGPARWREIREALVAAGYRTNSVSSAISHLHARGVLEKTADGLWRATGRAP